MSAKSDEIRQRLRDFHDELRELEGRAEIRDVAEKLRSEPPHYHLVYDAAEPHSDEQRDEERAEEDRHKERTTLRIRNLYFSVRDVELRKLLIAKDREIGELSLSWHRQELDDANTKLALSRASAGYGWIWASICGVALIYGGYHYLGVPGALCGLLLGYIYSRMIEVHARRNRDIEIAVREEWATQSEKTWNKVRNEPQLFSRREAASGNPDSL
jgi:hypothetical protein